MQSYLLALLPLLAPLPAVAFGNLDCIAIEACGNNGCAPETAPFAITFDWPNETVTVDAAMDDRDRLDVLAWVSTGDDADSMGTMIDYVAPDEDGTTLRIIADGADITAYYTFERSGFETWVGTCDVRRAT